MMHIQKITNLTDLQPYRDRWDELAGDCVFRSWEWQTTWWQHYGEGHELFVLLVFTDEKRCEKNADETSTCCSFVGHCGNSSKAPFKPKQLMAILPCYLETSFARGQTLRLIGDGEVCSDYLDLLTGPAEAEPAATALARYLVDHAVEWDTTDFKAVGVERTGLIKLADELHELGCHVTRNANVNCWALTLPESWEEFLAMQSKSHRKQLRRLEKRVLDTEQAVWHLVNTPEDLDVAWPILIDLHQRRRISLGEPGCFASQRWANFHIEIARKMLAAGKLRLSWLELNGQPAAVEYQFAGESASWSYQSGVDPDRIEEEPGRLVMIRTIQHAINAGETHFDFLRGDEPYKPHWRAEPQATFDLRIVPNRNAAVWRSQACNKLLQAVRFARQFTAMLG